MVLKLHLHTSLHIISWNPEGACEPEIRTKYQCNALIVVLKWFAPEEKEYNFNPTDDGEASEESHGASNETQLGLSLDLLVPLDLVVGGRVKVDLHQLEGGLGQFLSWND